MGRRKEGQCDEEDDNLSGSLSSDTKNDFSDDDPSFVSEEEEPESTTRAPWKSWRGRGRNPEFCSRSPGYRSERGRLEMTMTLHFLTPLRMPGLQLDTTASHSPLDLFKLHFGANTMQILCTNTNKKAAINQAKGKKCKWADVAVEELYKFFGIILYTSLVSLSSIQDYWRKNHIFSMPFPAVAMARD
ncbi:hypothetical protein LDENG_00178810 [Lucifuga dentata]|nr:hypothetical protein LDENG_00178810 [Lucifuga dentata]